jgi:hypothetical protein
VHGLRRSPEVFFQPREPTSDQLGWQSPARALRDAIEPDALAGLYGAAREACGVAEIRRAREAGATAALRQILGDPGGVSDVLASLRRGAAAADVPGRPPFAGLVGMAAPDDELGQLWHVCAMFRECRGDSHLAALVSAGLGGLEANIITELWVGYELTEYSATRAWSPEAIERATEGLRARGLIAEPTGGLGASRSSAAIRA